MARAAPYPSRMKPASMLEVGGGIAGMGSALDQADSGLKVHLVERTPRLGGRVAQLRFMFPQHDCVLCRRAADHGYGCSRPSISPAHVHHTQHPKSEIHTLTRVMDVERQAGHLTVSLPDPARGPAGRPDRRRWARRGRLH